MPQASPLSGAVWQATMPYLDRVFSSSAAAQAATSACASQAIALARDKE